MRTAPSFDRMPDAARLWVFAAAEPLPAEKAEQLLSRVDDFLGEWHAHGHPVVGARSLLHDRFLLIAADEEATGVSGCSIDSLFRVLKQAERDLGVDLLDSARVFHRDRAGELRSSTRAEFRQLAAEGAVGPEDTVFDNTVSTVGALRRGGWERPARESWHGRAFLPQQA